MSDQGYIKKLNTVEANFYVSPLGNDTWSGRIEKPNYDKSDGPFATLDAARDAIKIIKKNKGLPPGGIIVEIMGGTYELTKPFILTGEDSGTQNAPVVYRSQKYKNVQFVGGRILTGFSHVTDPDILNKLDPVAQRYVVQTNLFKQGITDIGGITAPDWANGQPGLELFFKGKRMTIARWPNEDFVKVESIDVEGYTPLRNRVTISGKMRGSNEGRFIYQGDRPKRWLDEKDVWLHGYWFWDWADQRQKVISIDPEKRTIELEGPNHKFGYRDDQWYYALNILAELDQPNEWYLDRENGNLYFWSPEPIAQGDVIVSITPVLVDMKQASHVIFQGITFEAVRGTAITIEGGSENLICACIIRNTSSWGVKIKNGACHGVVGCDIYELGEGGILMVGGDRVTLTAGNHYAINNHVHHCSCWNPLYQPGIATSGVGNRIAHNLLDNLPHMAIGFTGNDHLIEYNEIHSAVYMANDAGAIYTSPPTEEFTMYGNIIRYNYIHHIYGFKNRGCNGAIYLDDMFPGTYIYGNVFYKVPRAVFIGGGRYNIVEKNIFVDCTPSVHIDARGLGWASGDKDMLVELLHKYPYRNEVWSKRYPSLVNILEDDPMVPKGNVVTNNVCWKGSWDEIEDKAQPHVTIKNNLVDVDPLFIDEENENFHFKDSSPAYDVGFKAISMNKIGIYNDELRASWPVRHDVREGKLVKTEEKTW